MAKDLNIQCTKCGETLLSEDELLIHRCCNIIIPKEGGLPRNPEGKPEWDLVDWESLEPMVRVLMHGAKKYTPDNWKEGYPIRRTFSSLMRHMTAFMDGEDIDPESGESHLGHAMCNLLFMQYMLKNKPEFDDRDRRKATGSELQGKNE